MTFEDAVLTYFELDSTHTVEVEIEGPRERQIGDYTWDSDPGGITVRAYGHGARSFIELKREERFSSLPELWNSIAG